MKSFEEQRDLLRTNAAEIIPGDEFDSRLQESIATSRPLRVKLGLDPTAKHVTLGWTVVLRKLRQFQELGHTAVLIVGDFTARVGDPSGRTESRKPLSKSEVDAYVDSVLAQFDLVVSDENLEIRRNSEWLETMDMASILEVTSHYTVARMLERDDFHDRYREGNPISMMEFLYPILQGYDSIAIEADVELGGTDQTFNLLIGRTLQERYGQRAQVAMTMPLIEGLDGVQKMSQSLGNYIGITEPPEEIFGKTMSLPDPLMVKYYRLTTDLPLFRVDETEEALEEGKLHPAEAKRQLAWELVRMYHGEEAADAARERFDRIYKEKKLPDDVPEFVITEDLVKEGQVFLPGLLV
ncbi:MAG: tyrosine--tRNA ligase, partial [Acidimicrobiia bacterium]